MDYSKILSPVVVGVPLSGIRKYFDIAESMQGVISLGVGEPDFPTPWEIRKAGIMSLESCKTRYTANRGLLQLRREIGIHLIQHISQTEFRCGRNRHRLSDTQIIKFIYICHKFIKTIYLIDN